MARLTLGVRLDETMGGRILSSAKTAKGRAMPVWAVALFLASHAAQAAPLRAAHPHASAHYGAIAAVSLHAGDNSLGARVVAFARSQQGRQVGDGECTDLADAALQQNGGRTIDAYAAASSGNDDYTWGKPVSLRDARPGDILQFRDFNTTTTVSSGMSESTMTDMRDHHTAIVEQNLGSVLVVLEQNVPPMGRVVQRNRIPIESMTYSGDPGGNDIGRVRTTVQVEGSIKAYRPQLAMSAE
jgi:hypothetical protein